MSSVNKVILVGRLGTKPEAKFTPNGKCVVEMRIATDGPPNKEGVRRTEWSSVIAWGKTAENCAKYLEKGRQVYVEGRLQTSSWEDKNGGARRYRTDVVAESVTFLGSKSGSGTRENDLSEYGPTDSELSF